MSPDGKTLVTEGGDTARLWDTSTGHSVGPPLQHESIVSSVAFSPDGKTVVTGSNDRTARLWDATTGLPVGAPLLHQEAVRSVAFSPNGKKIRTIGKQMIRNWDVATGLPIGRSIMHQGYEGLVAVSPDAETILAGIPGHEARLWDAATGQPIGPPLEREGLVRYGEFSPDGKTIAAVSNNGANRRNLRGAQSTTRLWHLPTLVDDDLSRVKIWVETMTGLAVDNEGNINALESAAWHERGSRLRELGGPLKTDSGWLFDPVLYGPDPAAHLRVDGTEMLGRSRGRVRRGDTRPVATGESRRSSRSGSRSPGQRSGTSLRGRRK